MYHTIGEYRIHVKGKNLKNICLIIVHRYWWYYTSIYVKKKYEKEEIEFLAPLLKGNPFEFRGESHDLRDIVSQMASEHIRKRIEPEVMKHWEGRWKKAQTGGAEPFSNLPFSQCFYWCARQDSNLRPTDS